MKNEGDLPKRNARELDRAAIAAMYGWTLKEIYDAAQAFKAMYRRQPTSDITFRQYLDLMKEQGLRPLQVDLTTGGYHLARHGDAGAYSIGNCRFVTGLANQLERQEGYQRRPAFREEMSRIAMKRPRIACAKCGGAFTPSMLARWHGGKCRLAYPA